MLRSGRKTLMNTNFTLAGAFCAFVSLLPFSITAGTAAGTMAVSASVASFCTLSATEMAFGAVSETAHTTASSVITLSCNATGITPTTVIVGGGLNSAHDITTVRAMNSGTDFLSYKLVLAASTLTDMAADEVATLAAGSPATTFSVTLYGDIAPGSNPAKGIYSDTIGLTVSFTP